MLADQPLKRPVSWERVRIKHLRNLRCEPMVLDSILAVFPFEHFSTVTSRLPKVSVTPAVVNTFSPVFLLGVWARGESPTKISPETSPSSPTTTFGRDSLPPPVRWGGAVKHYFAPTSWHKNHCAANLNTTNSFRVVVLCWDALR